MLYKSNDIINESGFNKEDRTCQEVLELEQELLLNTIKGMKIVKNGLNIK